MMTRASFTECGAPDFYRSVTAARRRRRIDREGRTRLYGETFHLYTPEEYGWMRLFLTPEGDTGYALRREGDDLDLVSVFSASSRPRGRDAVEHAVEQGANILDCFDEDDFLPGLYRAFGFVEIGRVAWDDSLAPPGWGGGRPDVVLMRRP